jgi:hypothetical protein
VGLQRRGTHVSPLKIGSRDGQKCFGGILAFYAELRRDLDWGNLNLGFFEDLFGGPRGTCEEGGTLCTFWGNVLCWWGVLWSLTAASKTFAPVCCSIKVRGTAKNIEVMVRDLKR